MGEARRRKFAVAARELPPAPPVRPREKRVTVEVTVRIPLTVPEDWDDDMVRFWVTESSLCGGSFVAEQLAEGGCGCEKILSAGEVKRVE